ncbi:hypothetical protein [Limosilactobacillus sp.]|uniref:hypothetical protein n=1 Tax=Limosilactobacillus sp. TaxID=2773925 RepID=UPI003F09DEB1
MDEEIMELRALPRLTKRRPAYVLLTSLVVLACICVTLMFQYRYYANQFRLEKQLRAALIQQTHTNLRLEKMNKGKRILEFSQQNR